MSCRCWLAVLIAWGAYGIAQGDGPAISHVDSFSGQGLLKADIAGLEDTQLVAHPDARIHYHQNLLWCGTLQLAWNKAIRLVGEKLHFDHQPPLVDLLNREDFTEADLDPACYVAVADFERNNPRAKIRAALEKTFRGAASPGLIPPRLEYPGPDAFIAYAYLYKNLPFRTPFENNEALMFGNAEVANFGFNRGGNGQTVDELRRQVKICDYKSESDFIIELSTKLPQEQLILAEMPPGATLEDTILRVRERMDWGHPMKPGPDDMLAIPKLNLDLSGAFPALEGLVLQPGSQTGIKSRLVIKAVEQLVRFQLNENGAVLKSEADMVVDDAGLNQLQTTPHHMIFNRPFLILMKQVSSREPYFALWVGNASLLVPASAKGN